MWVKCEFTFLLSYFAGTGYVTSWNPLRVRFKRQQKRNLVGAQQSSYNVFIRGCPGYPVRHFGVLWSVSGHGEYLEHYWYQRYIYSLCVSLTWCSCALTCSWFQCGTVSCVVPIAASFAWSGPTSHWPLYSECIFRYIYYKFKGPDLWSW